MSCSAVVFHLPEDKLKPAGLIRSKCGLRSTSGWQYNNARPCAIVSLEREPLRSAPGRKPAEQKTNDGHECAHRERSSLSWIQGAGWWHEFRSLVIAIAKLVDGSLRLALVLNLSCADAGATYIPSESLRSFPHNNEHNSPIENGACRCDFRFARGASLLSNKDTYGDDCITKKLSYAIISPSPGRLSHLHSSGS